MSSSPKPPVMQHEFEVYVATKCKCGQLLPEGIRRKVLEDARGKMSSWFGGATQQTGLGVWIDDDGQEVQECVEILHSNARVAGFESLAEEFRALIFDVGSSLSQSAGAGRIDHKLLVFPTKTGKCTHQGGPTPGPGVRPEAVAPRPVDRRRDILIGLTRLDGLDAARSLFVNRLHYEYENSVISTHGWPESVRSHLVPGSDPVVIAGQNGFEIIYLKLAANRLLLAPERQLVERILHDLPDMRGLVVVSDASQQQWHLINVKFGAEGAGKSRFLLRRMCVGPDQNMRTAVERLALVDVEALGEAVPAAEIQAAHDKAFDVQAVTDAFFASYREVFQDVESHIKGFKKSEGEARRLFTQQLLNRLMFVAFIERKGWLKISGRTDYLRALWQDYEASRESGGNFFRDRLRPLFFLGLNNAANVDIVGINDGGILKHLIGDVPFLNGGLFEEDTNDKRESLEVPDRCVRAILIGLFSRFNFTVTESTPLDQEVAVDPEMLGTIFEELVTGRHEQGAYYTPKPIVQFMGREALKFHLRSSLPGETERAISEFVEHRDPSALRAPEQVLDALRKVKVCDPACGSGAYLLGMLHELFDLRACLFAVKELDPISTYERKLEIIQTNIYGVDIDPFATNIAKLRLWLSLAVEFEGLKPPPLPNLEFKIETGDSLAAPMSRTAGQQALVGDFLRQYRDAKARFLSAHSAERVSLRKEIASLRNEIASWAHGDTFVEGFDWPVEFAEVFTDGGFDIIVANPPYVRADAPFRHLTDERERQAAIAKWKEYRAALLDSGIYETLYEKWDLYVPFLERAHQLLRGGGRLIFIIADSYNAAKYARKSHDFFLTNSSIERIDFCTDIPIFEAGVSNTIVHFHKTKPDPHHQPGRIRRWGDSPDDFDKNSEILPTSPQAEFGEALFKLDGTKPQAAMVGFVPLSVICYISYGLRANADDRFWKGEFVTEDLVSDVRDKKHPKPFVEGKDLIRWWTTSVRYLEWGTSRAPGRFARPTFPQLHEPKEKLVAVRTPGAQPKVMFDTAGLHFDASSVGFVPWHLLRGVINRSINKTAKYRRQAPNGDRDEREKLSEQFHLKYVLAVMNSTFAREWLAKRRRSKIHVYPDDWKELPVAPISLPQQQRFVRLVDTILAEFERYGYPLPHSAASRVAEVEREIDKRVYRLYGLTQDGTMLVGEATTQG